MKLVNLVLLMIFFIPCNGQQPSLLYLKGYGNRGTNQILSPIVRADDGGFIVSMDTDAPPGSGNIDSFCTSNTERTIFIRYNSDASVIEWSKCYNVDGDSNFVYMYPTADGGSILLGNYFNTHRGGIYITRHDAADNIVWSKSHSKFANTINTICASRTYDSGFIVAGAAFDIDSNVTNHYGAYTDADISIFRLDSLGNKIWSKVYGGSDYEYVKQIVEGPGHSWYLVGSTPSNDHDCTGNHGGSGDVYLLRIDSAGNVIWHRDLGGGGYDRGWSAWPTSAGGLLVTAQVESSDGDVHNHIGTNNTNIWVASVDSTGTITWENCYGGGVSEYPHAICIATDGSIWITGVSSTAGGEVDTFYGGNNDAYIVHADGNGVFLSAKVLGSTPLNGDAGNAIFPLPGGLVFMGGYYASNNGSFSFLPAVEPMPAGILNAFTAVFAPWTTDIKYVRLRGDVKLFPNPAKEQVEVILSNSEKSILRIVDVSGKLVYQGVIKNEKTISVSGWSKGIYYVQVVNRKEEMSVQKMIVQ